ncbi:MAG TPA: zinc ABC transporter substrate-binding protein [Coleofasciculaceae cyanobacterium]|jgi:manganese/iron transport system substrate-binding protein
MLKSFSVKPCFMGRAANLGIPLAAIARCFAAASLMLYTLGLTGCGSSQQTTNSSGNTTSVASSSAGDASKPKVVATSSVLCDVIQKIAQETVDLTCLIPAGTDPHVYQAKPTDRKAIEQAKLILYNGYGFEPTLIKLIKATQNSAPKIAVNEIAVPKPLKGEEHEHEAEAEKKGGKAEAEHDPGESNPHVWHNAQNGVRIVETVRDNLEKLSPSNATQYSSNAKKMTSELTQLDSWIKSQISTIPANQRKLVTTHDAMGYYASAYGIPVEGALQGISTEEKPAAGRVKALVQDLKKTGVPTIFPEATINPKLIAAVAKEANVKVSKRELFADGLGEKGSEGDTYEKMLIANTKTVVEGLGGKYTPFQPK